MAKKRRRKRQSVAAIAQRHGIPRAAAKQVAAHVKKSHDMFANAQTEMRKAKHAATLIDFKDALAKLGDRIKEVQTNLDTLIKELKVDMAALQKDFATAINTIMADEDPGSKGGDGRP